MKKEDVLGLIIYLVIIALAIVFGITVLQTHNAESALNGVWNGAAYILYVGGAVISGAIFNAVLYELGHVLGAKVGKYEILSINILGFCFYRDENKTKFRPISISLIWFFILHYWSSRSYGGFHHL